MDYDLDRYDAWTWKHPLMMHWILNPALAFNELVLGQRIPCLTLIDTQSEAPLADRTYIPCPHCQAMNPASLYAKTGLGNYAGVVCAECGEEIPTLKNALTWVMTFLTWPIWAPIKYRFGPALRARQQARLLQGADHSAPATGTRPLGLILGVVFGVLMGAFFIVKGLLDGGALSGILLSGALGGAIGGVVFGVSMKLFLTVAGRRAPAQSS